tara:strand:- start:277 stop:405 length:129 start_codon:yes stop_codon:yes gene_type:complete
MTLILLQGLWAAENIGNVLQESWSLLGISPSSGVSNITSIEK